MLREDINRHLENPQYNDYETTAKRQLARMVCHLRSGGHFDFQSVLAFDRVSFELVFGLMKNVLLEHYSESLEMHDGEIVNCWSFR